MVTQDGTGEEDFAALLAESFNQDTVKEGVTTFKSQPSSFFTAFTDSGPNSVVSVCLDMVTTGKPCPGNITVKLP